VGKRDDIVNKARASTSNVRFTELRWLAESLGFILKRVKGSHHIFANPDTHDVLNLQPEANGKAKSYQVKQVLQMYDTLHPEESEAK
jgi:predicted RNA binding protein YcfA (HicA-like mRNA interferase family)